MATKTKAETTEAPAEDAPEEQPAEVEKPDPAETTPEVPAEGTAAAETPSGYALRVSGGDPDAYAKARAVKRYGIGS